jgi:hypothetical protein
MIISSGDEMGGDEAKQNTDQVPNTESDTMAPK